MTGTFLWVTDDQDYSGNIYVWQVDSNSDTWDNFFTLSDTADGGVAPGLSAICLGSDNNYWATDSQNYIWQLNPISMTGTNFYLGIGNQNTAAICAGPDGNLWIPAVTGVTQTTTSGFTTFFPFIPSPSRLTANYGICSGSDGNLWVTDQDSTGYIWQVTTSGSPTEFALDLADPSSLPGNVCVGSDDNMWVADQLAGYVWQVATDGSSTSFNITSDNTIGFIAICAGPDGNLWLTASDASVWVVATDGSVAGTIPLGGSSLQGICQGTDGAVWAVDSLGQGLWQMQTDLTTTAFFQIPDPYFSDSTSLNGIVSSVNSGMGGDPHFVGFDGVRFDFHGKDGKRYVIYDDGDTLVTARFAHISKTFSVMDEIMVRTNGKEQWFLPETLPPYVADAPHLPRAKTAEATGLPKTLQFIDGEVVGLKNILFKRGSITITSIMDKNRVSYMNTSISLICGGKMTGIIGQTQRHI